jgi:hypothetical protein
LFGDQRKKIMFLKLAKPDDQRGDRRCGRAYKPVSSKRFALLSVLLTGDASNVIDAW